MLRKLARLNSKVLEGKSQSLAALKWKDSDCVPSDAWSHSFWKTALQDGIHLVKQLVSIQNYKNVCPVLFVYEFNAFVYTINKCLLIRSYL